MEYRKLAPIDIQRLEAHGCTSTNWDKVHFAGPPDPLRVRNVHFDGEVKVGVLIGAISAQGLSLESGLFHCRIVNSIIGSGSRIANIGVAVANMIIGDNVLIEDVLLVQSEPGATFGNGVVIETLNEAGGREATLHNGITAQTAYLQAVARHDVSFTKALTTILVNESEKAKGEKGYIGEHAQIIGCGVLKNVSVGQYAQLTCASHLENGTILSTQEHPTIVGDGVHAKNFIIAEGARVESGAILDKVFVGQGTKMGKQFSAENTLFFANCEAFHGETASVFAGPYTVTHHKSTLLIAGLFSFYNAGSGTNLSNHMYKLGPVHQGVFERGSKTGSFSYTMFESRVGAFSVLIGKHMVNINVPNLPFSNIYEKGGESFLVPGINLLNVGTVRDGEKWPKRDNRKVRVKRDLIVFDVFSPYVVEKMRRGRDELLKLSENTPKERDSVLYNGVIISRFLLRKGAKFYSTAITRHLTESLLIRLQKAAETDTSMPDALATKQVLAKPLEWTDLCGLIAPSEKVRTIEADVVSGAIKTYQELTERLNALHLFYTDYEWAYLSEICRAEYGFFPPEMTFQNADTLVEEWLKSSTSTLSAIVEDAKKEFGELSKISYGLDLPTELASAEFDAVRGTPATNAVVRKLTEELASLPTRADNWRQATRKLFS